MLSIGVSNILGSCCRSLPITSSFTRTAINNASGVCTPLGGLVTGGLVLVALTFLTDAFYYIPKATLAAVVICAVIFLCEYEAFFLLWKIKSKCNRTNVSGTAVLCMRHETHLYLVLVFPICILHCIFRTGLDPSDGHSCILPLDGPRIWHPYRPRC